MSTSVQGANRCLTPVNITLTTVAVVTSVIAAVALAVLCSVMAPPLLLFPGAYCVIAIVSGSISFVAITALVVKTIIETNRAKISSEIESDIEDVEEFVIPSEKPKNVGDDDWDLLSELDLTAEKEEAILTEQTSGLKQQYIKISRTKYDNLTYSYILHKSGKLYRCSHKRSLRGGAKEEAIGKGGFKTAYNCYDQNNKDTLVRAVVQDENRFLNTCKGFFDAYAQYPDDPELITGTPHTYYSIKHKKQRQVFYSEKQICLVDFDLSKLTQEQSIDLFRQILELIERVHVEGGAHKDIKLDNVFMKIDSNGKVKAALMDFDLYTRNQVNGDAGTKVCMPSTFIGRKDLTLRDCQQGDVYAAAFIAIAIFGGIPLYKQIINWRFANTKASIYKSDIDDKFKTVARSNPLFQKIAPLIRNILVRKRTSESDESYRNASAVLALFDRKISED